MKVTVLVVTALVLALGGWPIFSVSNAGQQNMKAQEPVRLLVADSGIYEQKTCSGQQAAPRPETYVFALSKDGSGCNIRTYIANDYDEALGCARKSCPDCDIEDITWLSMFSTSATDISNYCLTR